jgi:type I restriction enzyme S subunit
LNTSKNLNLTPFITGAVQPKLNKANLLSIPIFLPENEEQQRAIAEVLSSLDDKIDLLHRQNKTLEQMAETLFRQWFIERSKEDWEEGTISDISKHSKITVKPSNNPNIFYSHYSIPAFDDGKEPILEMVTEIRSNKYKVIKNSILFSKLNTHKDKRIWLILEQLPENPICSTEFQIIEPLSEAYLYFIYGWLSNPENYREIASGVSGTSGSHQRISPQEIFSFPIPLVPKIIIEEYKNIVKPIFLKQQTNQQQIRTLEKLRDTLLPKLMSGEVRVKY